MNQMDDGIFLSGGIDGWPPKSEMARIMRAAGFDVYVGQYSIRLRDCDHFVFQSYGGDICDPVIDADGNTLESMIRDAKRVSDTLTSADIRHRFEIYNGNDEMVGYLHHKWPQAPVA